MGTLTREIRKNSTPVRCVGFSRFNQKLYPTKKGEERKGRRCRWDPGTRLRRDQGLPSNRGEGSGDPVSGGGSWGGANLQKREERKGSTQRVSGAQ